MKRTPRLGDIVIAKKPYGIITPGLIGVVQNVATCGVTNVLETEVLFIWPDRSISVSVEFHEYFDFTTEKNGLVNDGEPPAIIKAATTNGKKQPPKRPVSVSYKPFGERDD